MKLQLHLGGYSDALSILEQANGVAISYQAVLLALTSARSQAVKIPHTKDTPTAMRSKAGIITLQVLGRRIFLLRKANRICRERPGAVYS